MPTAQWLLMSLEMAPARALKRQKTNPTEVQRAEPSLEQAQQAANVPLPPEAPATATASKPEDEKRSVRTRRYPLQSVQTNVAQSWLARTWPRKAPPLTQTHRESVSSASNINAPSTTPTTSQEVPPSLPKENPRIQRSSSLAMTLGKSKSNRSLPVNATTSLIHAKPEAGTPSLGRKESQSGTFERANENGISTKPSAKDHQRPEKATVIATQPETAIAPIEETLQPPQQEPMGQSMWLSWLPGKRDDITGQPPETQTEAFLPPKSLEAPPMACLSNAPGKSQPETLEQAQPPSVSTGDKRSWYQMFSSSNTPAQGARPTEHQSTSASASAQPSTTEAIGSLGAAKDTSASLGIPSPSTPKVKEGSQASSFQTSPPPPLPGDGSKSGWVFWSREKKRPESTAESTKSDSEPRVGEIAISDTPSQARPKRASISLKDESKPILKPSPQEIQSKKIVPQKAVETKRTDSSASATGHKMTDSQQDASRTVRAESSNAAAIAKEPRPASTASSSNKKTEDLNLLLPPLRDTLVFDEQPSILQQFARLFYYTREQSQPQNLSLVKDPPRIRNALAIGVHGYFPGPMIQKILGQPTGTSIKFAEKAAQNIRKYTKSQGYSCEVKTAALEGEGRIAERVELLWKLLLNWIDEIRRSDFVMIAAHSQGVPVAIMLVAKLIHFGCLSSTARVGICAMAGVNLGPFQDYKSPWITGSAGELFEFTNPDSKVSKDYMAAIGECLRFGVKVTFVGSIDDQLVSMESSIFAPLTHPHIYRAVSIDSRIHAPNFLSNLVGFVLKLRNVGVPDHGLIRELSTPLAGSLYTGEGHSRIYEDDAVYSLAISYTLATTSLPGIPISCSKRQAAPASSSTDGKSGSNSTNSNPYILPFAMRGILEEEVVKRDLRDEARGLLQQFDAWEPKTKVLKDVKFRLEGVRLQLL